MAPGDPVPSNRPALLALAGAAAVMAAVSLVTVGHLKDVVIAAYFRGQRVGVPLIAGSLRPVDLGLAALALAAVAGLAWMEWRHRAFTRLLHTATGTDAFWLLTVLVAFLGHSYLGAGVLLGGDTGTHVSRFLEVSRGLDAGTLPQWTNYQYTGAPLLWFTGPLTYVVGGVLTFLVRDAVVATRVLLFGLHVLGGWACFAFLRRLGLRPLAAALAAAGFAGTFAHLHLFLYRGTFPQAFTIVFVVVLFHAADGLLRGVGARWANVLLFALATAGAILNHQPHAVFAAFYLGVFGAVALATGFWRWRGVPLLVAAGTLGALAGIVAVLPVLAEADWVMIEPEGPLFGVRLPTLVRLGHLVLWNNTRTTWGPDYWAYLGLGLLVFGAAGIVGLLRGQLRGGQLRGGRLRGGSRQGPAGAALPALACLLPCLVLFNPVVRDVLFIVFFLAVLAGLGLDWLAASPALRGRRLLAAALVAVIDLGSTAVQPVARTDKGFLMDAGQTLERTDPNHRVMQVTVAADGTLEADIGPDGGPLSYAATVQRIAGNHNMAATRLHNILVVGAKQAQTELQATGTLSPASRALLAMLNVGRIICNTATANGCPASIRDATAQDPVLGRYVPLPATPAVFSRHLVTQVLPPGLDKPMLWPDSFAPRYADNRILQVAAAIGRFLDAEGFDAATRTAGAIPVQDAGPATPEHAGAPSPPEIMDHTVTLEWVRLRLRLEQPGFVQVAYPFLPSTVATVNGAAVRPVHGTLGLMVLPMQAGTTTIELHEGWTLIRRASVLASLAGLLAILGMTAWLAIQDRRRRPADRLSAGRHAC